MKKNTKKIKKTSAIDIMKLKGIVIEALGGANFKVKIHDTEHVVDAYLSGKMYKNTIQVLVGDSVDVEVSKYDLTKGRINFRTK